jgi:hypothetical protein
MFIEIIKQLYNCINVLGPYVGDDGRKRCVLYFSDKTTSSRAYAKLLLEAKLGCLLKEGEEADHKNNDPTDDSIDNLQVVTSEYNKLKHHYNYIMNEQVCYGFTCAYCETPFLLTEREVKQREKVSKTGLAFCSRSCCSNYLFINGLISPPHK